jgi:tetratricopeptide (TPR) repeat protein
VNTWRSITFSLVFYTAAIAGCAEEKQQPDPSTTEKTTRLAVPEIDTSQMQPRVASRIREAQQAVARKPDSADAWGRLGMVCHVHREHEPATVCYREASRLATNDFRWVYFLARLLEIEGHASNEVIALYEKAVGLNPSYAPTYARLGDALVREGRLEEGILVLEKAVGLDPKLSKAQRSFGQVLLMLGEDDRALNHLETASKLQPNDAAVWAALAQGYARNGADLRAADAAKKAAARKTIHALVDPAMQEVSNEGISSTICARRAREYVSRGDFAHALEQFLIVVEVDPDNAQLQLKVASVARRAGRPRFALKHLARAIELAPSEVAPRTQLASLLLQEGRAADAVLRLRNAVAEIRENSELHAMLGAALAQSGRAAEAIAEFQRADQLGELSAKDYSNWGNSLRANGALEDAVDRYQSALRIDPNYANAHYNLGTTLEQLDRVESAIEHYRAAVKLDPNHPAKAKLARLLSDRQ